MPVYILQWFSTFAGVGRIIYIYIYFSLVNWIEQSSIFPNDLNQLNTVDYKEIITVYCTVYSTYSHYPNTDTLPKLLPLVMQFEFKIFP